MSRTPLIPSDLYRLALPSDPQCAPDGRVFYVLATMDEPADETRTAIYTARVGRPPVRFTSGASDRMPRPSSDGSRLAFVSDRGDGKRVYVVSLDGGEAQAVSASYDAIVALAWSRDSTTLAFVATAAHEPNTARIAFDERSGARHIRALPFKSDDDGLLDGRRRHLFTLVPGSEAVQVTQGDFDVHGPAWSPDGTRIAFSAQIDLPETSFIEDVYAVSLATGAISKLTASLGSARLPAFSPDGREIAFVGHEHGDDVGGRFNTELFAIASGGIARSLSASTDRSANDEIVCDTRGQGAQAPQWTWNGGEIVVPLSDEGTCAIVAFRRDGSGHRRVAAGERDISRFSIGPHDSCAFVFSSPAVPGELAFLDGEGNERILTDANPWLAERSIREPRRSRPRSADGTLLDLWLLDPEEPIGGSSTPAPYVLQVHGGPHAAYGFAFMFEFQVLAAHGIGVGYGNPRGSQSYGMAYADAITGDWGGIDVDDVLALLDGLLANASVDPARVGLAGGSYGGFMTTSLLGRSDRFAAGVSMRAVNDFVSEVGASDLGWFLEVETAAPWTDGGARLFALSPLRNAHRIDVPLLVEHSERDYRCPIDQGEQLFTLLRRLGRQQTEFVRFSGDGHGLSRTGKPRNRVLRLRAIAHWFIRHLHPSGVSSVPPSAGSLFAPLSTEETSEAY